MLVLAGPEWYELILSPAGGEPPHSSYLPTTDPVSELTFTEGKAWKWLIWDGWAVISLPGSFTSLPDVTPDRETTGGNWQKDTEEADKE